VGQRVNFQFDRLAEPHCEIGVVLHRVLGQRVDQDITLPMMGFKTFEAAQSIISGIELMLLLRKGQMEDDGLRALLRLKNSML
jgi:hypothetical protein